MGIGEAIALKLAEHGVNLILDSRSKGQMTEHDEPRPSLVADLRLGQTRRCADKDQGHGT